MTKKTRMAQRNTKNAGISLPHEVITQLEEMAGDVPKSRFVQRLIERALHEREIEGKKKK